MWHSTGYNFVGLNISLDIRRMFSALEQNWNINNSLQCYFSHLTPHEEI